MSGKNPVGYAFPAVAGSEGVGIVEKVGSDVSSVKENQMVMLIKPFQGILLSLPLMSRNVDGESRGVRERAPRHPERSHP